MPSKSGRHPFGRGAGGRTGGRAVVIGGSLTGMLAAAVLPTTMAEVTVVERHGLPGGPEPRTP